MITNAKFFIKGQQHPEFAPQDWQNLELEATFSKGNVQASLLDPSAGISKLGIVLTGQGAIKVFEHLDGGIDLSTGGAFEALPFDFLFQEGDTELKLEYYIDFTKPHLIHRDNYGARFEGQLVKRHSVDWLTENAEAFSFSYLFEIGEITQDLINFVEYLVEKEFDGVKNFLTWLAIAFIIEGVKQMIYELNEWAAKVGGVLPVLEAILVLFQILLKHITTIIATIALIRYFSEQILQGKRRHNGMYALDMAKSACKHLGLEFRSSILEGEYRNQFHLPAKDIEGFRKSDDENKGFPDGNSPIYLFSGWLSEMHKMFNAQIRIENGTLRLERRDFWRSMTDYTLPSTRLPAYSLNTGDLKANYIIRFTTDPTDRNTIENTDDLNYQITVEPKIKIDKDLNLLKGLTEKTILLAHGYRKEGLNGVEKVFNIITLPYITALNVLLQGVNEVRKLFNKMRKFAKKLNKILKLIGLKKQKNNPGKDPGNPQAFQIETIKNSRKNVLKLSDHTFSLDKVFLMKDGKVLPASEKLFSPEYLYKKFHIIEGFEPKYNNQGKIYTGVKVSFCLKDFVTLLNFNGFKTWDGKEGDMLKIKWRFKSNFSLLDFILYETYTNNFRNVEPKAIFTEEDETVNIARFHGDGFSDEFD